MPIKKPTPAVSGNRLALYDATVQGLLAQGKSLPEAITGAIHEILFSPPASVNGLLGFAPYSGQIETPTGAKQMTNLATLSILKTAEDVKRFEARAAKEWSGIAQEQVRCEVIGASIYAYGSELACLRLAYAFRDSKEETRVTNFRTIWYFSKVHGV